MSDKCGKCGLVIHKSEVGIRHMGTTRAHGEGRCIQLLHMRMDELRAQLADKDKELEFLQNDLGNGLRVGKFAIMIEIAEVDGKGEGMQTNELPELIDKFYSEKF